LAFIKSISGFRGTIGGKPGNNLTPVDIVECTSAFVAQLQDEYGTRDITIVLGRDGRVSGKHVSTLAAESIIAMGAKVIDCGLSTTPTVEMAVPYHNAQGGIIFTASHNPKEWNALKLLNREGEFLSRELGESVIQKAANRDFEFASIDDLGSILADTEAIERHITEIIYDDLILEQKVRDQKYHVIVDCINSTGAIAIPPLLEKLGCTYTLINEEVSGHFAHNPEPLAHHLTELSERVKAEKAQLGIAVDPDVDRLALVDEKGNYIGEEYTLVTVADYLSEFRSGTFVSNLSSSKALQDLVRQKGGSYASAAVGEVNVVAKMKEQNAVLGGEGNGGIIYPPLHYGRDALLGIAMVLSLMAHRNKALSELRASYPHYEMIKDKIALPQTMATETILEQLAHRFSGFEKDTIDGLKIYIDTGWVHLRASNTEPILRLYAEAETSENARKLADKVKSAYVKIVQS
jgi:phosphomannomutase